MIFSNAWGGIFLARNWNFTIFPGGELTLDHTMRPKNDKRSNIDYWNNVLKGSKYACLIKRLDFSLWEGFELGG